MKPLAIDLFCGLFQPKLLLSADTTIEELVARGAENPDHVTLHIRDDFPRAVSFEFWLVCDFENARLAARLTRTWNVCVPSAKASDNCIPELSPRIVDLLHGGLAAMKGASLLARRLSRALIRAISPVRIRRRDVEMGTAAAAMTARLRNVGLFAAPSPTAPRLACGRAVEFIRPHCGEWLGAVRAKQIIHAGFMP